MIETIFFVFMGEGNDGESGNFLGNQADDTRLFDVLKLDLPKDPVPELDFIDVSRLLPHHHDAPSNVVPYARLEARRLAKEQTAIARGVRSLIGITAEQLVTLEFVGSFVGRASGTKYRPFPLAKINRHGTMKVVKFGPGVVSNLNHTLPGDEEMDIMHYEAAEALIDLQQTARGSNGESSLKICFEEVACLLRRIYGDRYFFTAQNIQSLVALQNNGNRFLSARYGYGALVEINHLMRILESFAEAAS